MKKNILVKLTLIVISTIMISGCSNLNFTPIWLYKFFSPLKEQSNQKGPTIQLFTCYDLMCEWFDEFVLNKIDSDKEILNGVDFNKHNLFAYMQEDGTGSTIRAISLIENKITIYSYTPNVVTCDMAYKWFIFEVDKQYLLSDFIIEYDKMTKDQVNCLTDNYSSNYYF